jgi:hypothetical protein
VGAVVPIPPEHVASEHDRFLHRYGTAADRDAETRVMEDG